MLHGQTQFRLTEREWENFSLLAGEDVSVLRRRLSTRDRFVSYLDTLDPKDPRVSPEVQLLREIFIPWWRERLADFASD